MPRARDYTKTLSIAAPPEHVKAAAATLAGLRGWWTPLVTGTPRRRVRLRFEGMDEHIDLRLVTSEPTRVEWSVLVHTSLEEWAGTTLRFVIAPRARGTRLSFTHVGLSPALVCYEDCEAGWDHFLGSFAEYAERGQGQPFGGSPDRAWQDVVAAFARDRRVTPPSPSRREFGSNGLKVDDRIFAMLVRGAFVVKLPAARVSALVEEGSGSPFATGGGRVMKEWVSVHEPASWLGFAREARRFVGG